MNNRRKSKLVLRIVLLGLTVVVLTAVLVFGIAGRRWLRLGGYYSGSQYYQAGGSAVAASGLSALEIHWESGEVRLVPTDGENVVFREPEGLPEDQQLRYRLEDGRLIIRYGPSGLSLSATAEKTLTVEIPRQLALSQLELDLVSAHVQAQDLTVPQCEVDTVSGDVNFTGCRFTEVEVDTVSGDFCLTGQVDSLEMDSTSGDLALTLAAVPRQIDGDSVSGNFTLTLPPSAAFSVETDSLSGGFSCQFPTEIQDGRYICRQGGGVFQFDSVSGSVYLISSGNAPENQ